MSAVARTLHLARQHHQAGNLLAARQLYAQVLEAQPGHAEAEYLTGLLDRQEGRHQEAVARFRRAAGAEPGNAIFQYALGNALAAAGDDEQAARHLRRATKLHGPFADAHNNLGLALERLGRSNEAIRSFREALRANPAHAAALVNIGNAHRRRGELEEAADCFRRALAVAPGTAPAHNNLGNVLLSLGRVGEAVEHLTAAIDIDPRYAEAHNNLGTAQLARERYADAVACFEKALALVPGDGLVHLNLGNALLSEGRTDEGVRELERSSALLPDLVEARWAAALAMPILYAEEAEVDAWRARYAEGLDRLIDRTPLATRDQCRAAAAGVGTVTPFHLAYQVRDDRPLQERYGRFVHRIMTSAFPEWSGPPRRRARGGRGAGGRLRVGWVSSYLRFHAVGRLMLGFLERGDPARQDRFVYDTGVADDALTARCRGACEHWRRLRRDVETAAAQIAGDRLDAIVYPDIGMDPLATQLAALHLAPVQCMSWGHPVTSGLPSVGWFLSSAGMEPPGGAAHYAETLVELPGIGVCYERPEFPQRPLSRAELGLAGAEGQVILLSCQSLYKYLPRHDRLYARIAQRLPRARIVFVAAPSARVTECFRGRLGRAFRDAGLEVDRHVTILPRLDPLAGYRSLLRAADLALDTPGWSGGNTTLEAVAAGLPVVTLPGEFMRGRHAFGILTAMGLTETIARDEDAWVELAAALGADADRRRHLARLVAERAGALFDDVRPVRALEDYLERTVSQVEHAGG